MTSDGKMAKQKRVTAPNTMPTYPSVDTADRPSPPSGNNANPTGQDPLRGSETAAGAGDSNRRFFLIAGFLALGSVFLAWGLAMIRFMFPNVLREPPSRFKVGCPSDYPIDHVETKYKSKYGVWIVHMEYGGRGQIVALKAVCTHLGCPPNWLESEQKFKCPCHGSGFNKQGIHLEGPAPRPLERYAIGLADDGQIEIDKSRTFQQELGQWSDPDCYIPT